MVAILGLPIGASATIYNAATDFSATSNPNGVWSYGWSATLGGLFTADAANSVIQNLGGIPGVVQWRGNLPPNADGNPSVFENTTVSSVIDGTISMPAGALAMHPGSSGQYSVIQFIAPTAGQYSISAAFLGLDFAGPTSTDVHVLVNGLVDFNSVVNGFGAPSTTSFSSLVTLASGGTIDFVVGDNGGAGGQDASGPNFYNDSTGLSATITAVPEAGTMVAGMLILLPLGVSALRIVRKSQMA